MLHPALLLLALVAAGACDSNDVPSQHDAATGVDLSVAAAPDLHVAAGDLATAADLATPPDLTPPADLVPQVGYCANTLVYGTCAAAFFEPVSACFHVAGQCLDGNNGAFCWNGGMRFAIGNDQATGNVLLDWSANGIPCMHASEQPRKGKGPLYTFTVGNEVLTYDKDAGTVTCPNKMTVQLGNNAGGCASLQALIEPDTKACQMGACL